MEYWEFLLQKEGDESWLPLDTSQVEILEGRYRIMAHTSQTNTPVQIHISQELRDRTPPQRRRLRRRGTTSATGLMVVMPFTRLQEGTWELQCASETPASAEDAAPWCYAVQLQVVAQGTADDDDWFADDGRAGLGGLLATPTTPPLDSSDPPIDLDAAATAMDTVLAQLAAGLDAGPQPYQLTLPSTALLSGEGAPLSLLATIEPVTAEPVTAEPVTEGAEVTAGDERAIAPYPPLTLVVRLLDPQTATPVSLTATPLARAALPTTLSLSVRVPTGLSTRLLLGEVGLLAGLEVVALQQFTVTVDVAALFNAIANQAETEAGLGVVFPADDPTTGDAPAGDAPAGEVKSRPEISPTISPTIKPGAGSQTGTRSTHANLKTWDAVVGRGAPVRAMPIVTLPRSSPNLPPRIYYPSPHEAAARQPSLPPSLPTVRPPVVRPPVDQSSAPAPGPASNRDPAPEGQGTKSPSGSTARGLSLPPVPAPPRVADPLAPVQGPPLSSQPPSRPGPQLISHEAMGFKDLKLQDRFWSRLNELALNLQQEALEHRTTETETEIQTQAEVSAAAPGTAPDPAPVVEFVPFEGEFVIYEDEDPTLVAQPAAEPPVTASGEPPEVITPPRPVLLLPEGDLTAGEPVVVTLRVPFHPNRIYLKVWITDPQTRTLADEPRQIMNLLPNGQGQLEGSLQLTVPLGCLEAWFEAIAVDMVTQQESYKAIVSRSITPTGLSASSLDEFQI